MFLKSILVDQSNTIRIELVASRAYEDSAGIHAFNFFITHSLHRSDLEHIRQISSEKFDVSDDGNELHTELYVVVVENELSYIYDTYSLGPFSKIILNGMHTGVVSTKDLLSVIECVIIFKEQLSIV